MAVDHVKDFTTPMYAAATGNKRVMDLLWGDRVDAGATSGQRVKVRARGRDGFVAANALGGASLLEVYFIDVGQGDGVLVRTPDHKHILIDGGYNRAKQPIGKSAADFVDWKFTKDYGQTTIALDAMIASHCDADHYGGLWDLLAVDTDDELDADAVTVGAFYHAGVSWWKEGSGRSLGPKTDGHLTRLLGARASVGSALGSGSGPKLQGEWGQFLKTVHDQDCPISRLSQRDDWLPGFGAGSSVRIRVLAPFEVTKNGKPALKSLGNDSKNTNGHSVLLRLDHGRARILLTGDLNKAAQQQLFAAYAGNRMEFACDVAKGCHHGSDDVSLAFLQAMNAAATVISSGDAESHSHPRPKIVAASGLTGFLTTANDEIVTPLVYSTEIARSARIGTPNRVIVRAAANGPETTFAPAQVDVEYTVVNAGALQGERRRGTLSRRKIVDGLVYGLVNVRTDGETILCATLNENGGSWDYETFQSRF